jgi:para-nitrobenzyl esterase
VNDLRLELPSGWIEGVRAVAPNDSQLDHVRVFKGIPYAASTDGPNRWREPQPVTPWQGTLRCDRFGSVSIQAGEPEMGGHLGDFDCLNLNIWCPESAGPWPVMVWIPGGGFMRGGASDALYDGSAMAGAGVVFVSINYRIGVDGFMHFDEAAPNRGLADQMAALRWVHDHIHLFGGDPQRITLAGVSAGAGSVAHLLGLPQSQALFQRAILQSPSLQSHDLEDAARIRQALAGVLGVAATTQGMSRVPLPALTRGLASFFGDEALKKKWGLRPKNFFPVRPVIDGNMLKTHPLMAITERVKSHQSKRPVLLGCNADEMRFYWVPNGEIDRIDEARVQDFLQDIGWPLQSMHQYMQQADRSSIGDVFCAIQTDYYYRKPAMALAELLRQADVPVYLYKFNWSSPLYGGRMGAAHAMDIPFVLGNTAAARAQNFIGTRAPTPLAQDMFERWIRFVKAQDMPDWVNGAQDMRVFE